MLEERMPANGFEWIWARAGGDPGAPAAGMTSCGVAADPVLNAVSLLSRPEPDAIEKARSILERIIEAVQAERAFFFDVPRRSGGEPYSLGRCLVSTNIDREAVQDPEGKAPIPLLRDAVVCGRTIFSSDVESDPRWSGFGGEAKPRARALGVVPLAVRGETVGLLYFDHRFQPMEIDEPAGTELALYCHALAFNHHLERVVGENRSLWQDVGRLQEQVRSGSTGPPASQARHRPRGDRANLKGDYSMIVGKSPRMFEIFQLLDRISGSNAPILINGESGTGKELIANAIHRNSPRNGKPFVSENCGALTETLLESELFGYVKGAFTGAARDHKGLFELADSGTLFLDEVGDMSPSMQKKLLRVIQESVVRRVGGKDFIHVDVRLVCATNKDLLEECQKGNFREDLYYRLNVINIKIPSLRDRREDIPELVEYFLQDLGRQFGSEKTIEPGTMQRLAQYSWPGNIRELQNEVKRLYALSDVTIRTSEISEHILSGDGRDFLHPGLEKELADLTLHEATEKLEKEMIRLALIASRGNKSLVAKKLQIPKTSLYNKINKYQLDKELP